MLADRHIYVSLWSCTTVIDMSGMHSCHSNVVETAKVAIAVRTVKVLLNLMLPKTLFVRPGLTAIVASPGKVVLVFHVLPFPATRGKMPIARIAFVEGKLVARRAAVIVPSSPSRREGLATGAALEHGDFLGTLGRSGSVVQV